MIFVKITGLLPQPRLCCLLLVGRCLEELELAGGGRENRERSVQMVVLLPIHSYYHKKSIESLRKRPGVVIYRIYQNIPPRRENPSNCRI